MNWILFNFWTKKYFVLNAALFSIIFCSAVSLQSFDVKVLLNKASCADVVAQSLELTSPTGFILSSSPSLALGHEFPGKIITISGSGDLIFLNKNPLLEKLVYIFPMLSKAHVAALKSYVSCWFESWRYGLNANGLMLEPLFDHIVTSQDQLKSDAYDVLNVYGAQIINLFLSDLIDNIEEEPAITLATLTDLSQTFLSNRVKIQFLETLAAAHLTKDDRKKLEKDKKYRHQFFLNHVHNVLEKLMYELVPALPYKLLQQVLQQDLGLLEFDGNKYAGTFLVFHEKKQVYLINCLDIDDYLPSVIKHESWPGWPLEMNKVMAVACRTYLIWQVLQAQKINRAYHIENGIKHQTYKGQNCSLLKYKQAVDATKNMFVAFEGTPALTMYDACCGGIVPGNIDDAGHKKVSYLARSYPCTFCKNFKIFNWRLEFLESEIVKRMQKDFSKVTKIVDMSVQKKDKAGLVKKVLINVGNRKISISEKKMKTLFPEMKSTCYTIEKHSGKKYSIIGRGFGHHKGLCQWGACKLIKDDSWNFKEVLQFYYPGTTLMKLSYQR
jgi:stage II sporulation protein D